MKLFKVVAMVTNLLVRSNWVFTIRCFAGFAVKPRRGKRVGNYLVRGFLFAR